MSFAQRELDRLHSEILKTDENNPAYSQLYAAQQALGWALEPTGAKSPYDMIMGVKSAENTSGRMPACEPCGAAG